LEYEDTKDLASFLLLYYLKI